MKSVPIDDLKRNLSGLIGEAERGARILITRHNRVVASLAPAESEYLHVGSRFGRSALRPLLKDATGGRYLEALLDDRRGTGATTR